MLDADSIMSSSARQARNGKLITVAEVLDTIARHKGRDDFDIDDDSEHDNWFTKGPSINE
jgi:hypothetical protein